MGTNYINSVDITNELFVIYRKSSFSDDLSKWATIVISIAALIFALYQFRAIRKKDEAIRASDDLKESIKYLSSKMHELVKMPKVITLLSDISLSDEICSIFRSEHPFSKDSDDKLNLIFHTYLECDCTKDLYLDFSRYLASADKSESDYLGKSKTHFDGLFYKYIILTLTDEQKIFLEYASKLAFSIIKLNDITGYREYVSSLSIELRDFLNASLVWHSLHFSAVKSKIDFVKLQKIINAHIKK